MIGHSLLIDLNLFLSCKDFRTSFSSLSLPNSSDYPQENYSNCIALFASFAYGTILSPNIIFRLRRSAISVFIQDFMNNSTRKYIEINVCITFACARKKKLIRWMHIYKRLLWSIRSTNKSCFLSFRHISGEHTLDSTAHYVHKWNAVAFQFVCLIIDSINLKVSDAIAICGTTIRICRRQ